MHYSWEDNLSWTSMCWHEHFVRFRFLTIRIIIIIIIIIIISILWGSVDSSVGTKHIRHWPWDARKKIIRRHETNYFMLSWLQEININNLSKVQNKHCTHRGNDDGNRTWLRHGNHSTSVMSVKCKWPACWHAVAEMHTDIVSHDTSC
jgi:hypothetical protein